jgi:hypothetical protein
MEMWDARAFLFGLWDGATVSDRPVEKTGLLAARHMPFFQQPQQIATL